MGYLDASKELMQSANCTLIRMSLKDNLTQELTKAKLEVERITELLNLLEANPKIDRILELLGRKY